jgi:CheY-like chemotaxis protein
MHRTKPDKYMVLLVDNDPDWIELSQAVAELEGIYFSAHLYPDSALRVLQQTRYKMSAIIVDLKMPIMDGITMTSQIIRNQDVRQIPPEERIPIFWATGALITDDILRLQEKYCVVRIFEKPVDPLFMLKTVQNYTEKYFSGAPEERELPCQPQ